MVSKDYSQNETKSRHSDNYDHKPSFESYETQNCTNSDRKDASTTDNDIKSQEIYSSEAEMKDTEKCDSSQELNPNKELEDGTNESRNDNASPESLPEYDGKYQALPKDVDDVQYPHSAIDTMFDYTSEESEPDNEFVQDFDPDEYVTDKVDVKFLKFNKNRMRGKKRTIEEINQDNKKPMKNNEKKQKKENEYKVTSEPNDDIMVDVEMESLKTDMSKIELPPEQNMNTHNANNSSEN